MTMPSQTVAIGRRSSAGLKAILLATALAAGFSGAALGADKHQKLINCNLHEGPCTQTLAGTIVGLAVSPRPVNAMADLVFRVTLAGNPALESAPYIDLDMPGMNMGKNQVQLRSVGAGTYEGPGVIVRCKSGRRTWRATIALPGIGKSAFVFDVVY